MSKSWKAKNGHNNYLRLRRCWCVVPGCNNRRSDMPHKAFFTFPKDPKRCMKWLHACGINKKVNPHNSETLVCEDHFNLPEDMGNWYQYQLMPGTRPRLNPTAVPRVKQTVKPRTASEWRAKKRMVAELLASADDGTPATPAKTKQRKHIETAPADTVDEQYCIPLEADDTEDQTEEHQTSGSDNVHIKTEPLELLETEISEPVEILQNPETLGNETVYIKTEPMELLETEISEPMDAFQNAECLVNKTVYINTEPYLDSTDLLNDHSESTDTTEVQPDLLQTFDPVEEAPIVYRLPVPVSPPPTHDNTRDFGVQTQPPVVHITREFGVQARPVHHRSFGTQVLLKPKTVDRGCSPIQFLDEPIFVVCDIKTE